MSIYNPCEIRDQMIGFSGLVTFLKLDVEIQESVMKGLFVKPFDILEEKNRNIFLLVKKYVQTFSQFLV